MGEGVARGAVVKREGVDPGAETTSRGGGGRIDGLAKRGRWRRLLLLLLLVE